MNVLPLLLIMLCCLSPAFAAPAITLLNAPLHTPAVTQVNVPLLPAAPALRLITVEEPPASFAGTSGQPDGYVVAVVRSLQQLLHDQSPIELMPEGRAMLTAQQNPNVLLFSFSRTAERESQYHWILPVLRKRWQVVTRSDGPAIHGLETLRRLGAVGVVRGDVREAYLIQQGLTNLVAVTSHQQNLQMLQSGRVQAIVADSVELAYEQKRQSNAGVSLRIAFTLRMSDVYLMIPKGADAGQVQRWQQAAQSLQDSGRLQVLADQWQERIEQELQQPLQRDGSLLVF